MVRPLIASVLTVAALLLSAAAAGAHTDAPVWRAPAAPAASAAAPGSAAPSRVGVPLTVEMRAGAPVATAWPVLAAAAVLVAAGMSRRRLALALALLSVIVGVDAAVHSVHHLHDPGADESCALASGSTHAPAVLTDGTVVAVAPMQVRESRADAATPSLALRASRPDRGRAPPSSSAA